jgi:hemerythrin
MRSITYPKRRTRKEWKDTFAVGIEEIDAQHRGVLGMFNQLGDLEEDAG